MMAECDELFIDATFKVAPKKYYQLLNILGYILSHKIYVPSAHIIMNSKTKFAYKHIFSYLKELLSDNNINANFENKIITTDYEKSLRKAITEVLKPKYLQGCYFHFSKAIWKKCRDYGLTSKKFKKRV